MLLGVKRARWSATSESPLGDQWRVGMLPPRSGEPHEPRGRSDATYGRDLAVGEVEGHRADHVVADHDEDGGRAVDERVMDRGCAAGHAPLRRSGPEAGACDGCDPLGSVVTKQ